MTSDLKWSPNDLDGSNGIKKQFIAKCHVEVGAGGFLRFPIPPSRQLPWLDERLMAQFVEAELAQAVKEEREKCRQIYIDAVEWGELDAGDCFDESHKELDQSEEEKYKVLTPTAFQDRTRNEMYFGKGLSTIKKKKK